MWQQRELSFEERQMELERDIEADWHVAVALLLMQWFRGQAQVCMVEA